MGNTSAIPAAILHVKLLGAMLRGPKVERQMSPRSRSGGAPAAARRGVRAVMSPGSQEAAQARVRGIAKTARNATNTTSGSERPNLQYVRTGLHRAHVPNVNTPPALHAVQKLRAERFGETPSSELETRWYGIAPHRSAKRRSKH